MDKRLDGRPAPVRGIQRKTAADPFPNLRKLASSVGIDPAVLNTAFARATAALTDLEERQADSNYREDCELLRRLEAQRKDPAQS